jgi:hypothetical protein
MVELTIRRLLLIACLLTSAFGTAQGGVPFVIDDKDSVKDVISHFRSEMSSLIAQAGGEARVTLLRAFQLGDSLINALSAAYANSLDRTIGDLNEQQKKAFSDASHLIAQIDDAIKAPADKAITELDKATSVIADIASWSKRPIVTSYAPGFVPPKMVEDRVRILVFGVRLHGTSGREPKLKINKQEFTPDEHTDVSIGFSVPRSVFPSSDNTVAVQNATVAIFHDDSGWWPWNWFRVEEIPFRLVLTVLPESLGRYKTLTTVSVPRVQRDPFKSRLLSATKNGGGSAADWECYVPKDGFLFDINSATLQETKHTAYKDNDTSPGTNYGRMSYREEMKTERRICPQVTAATGCTACGGTTEGYLHVDLVRTVYDDVSTETETKPLSWKEDVIVELIFDAITVVAPATAVKAMQFLKVDPDLQNSVAILRPVRNWAAR